MRRRAALILAFSAVISACTSSSDRPATNTQVATTTVATTTMVATTTPVATTTQVLPPSKQTVASAIRGLTEALCSGGIVALLDAQQKARENPEAYLLNPDADIGVEGCNRAANPSDAVLEPDAPSLVTLESAFCSGWTRLAITSTRILAEDSNQEGLYAVLFDACMGYNFGIGATYVEPAATYSIRSDGICVGADHPAVKGTNEPQPPPGMRVCGNDVTQQSFQVGGARPDAGQCFWYESWLGRRIVEITEQRSFESIAIQSVESDEMTATALVDYYAESVLPWWEGLREFASEADVPPAYEEFHEAIELVALADLERAQDTVTNALSPSWLSTMDLARIDEMGALVDELLSSPLLDLARLDCGISGEQIDDPDGMLERLANGVDAALETAPAALELFDAPEIGNLMYRFCQAAESEDDIESAAGGLWSLLAWLNGTSPESPAEQSLDRFEAISISAILNVCPAQSDAFEQWLDG